MNKRDLITLSRTRIAEAKVLFGNASYDGAYYLAGYSVECAIKACIAGTIRNNVVPEKSFGNDFYQHNIEKLMRFAGLWPRFQSDMHANLSLNLNWAVVKDWSEHSRYQHGVTRAKAEDLIKAITARNVGVLSWVKKCW